MNFRAAAGQARSGGADRAKLGRGAARRGHARQRGVLSIKPFRRLWIALSLSSLGDWLSIVALTALAPSLATGGAVAKGSAVSGVWLATLTPQRAAELLAERRAAAPSPSPRGRRTTAAKPAAARKTTATAKKPQATRRKSGS